MATEGATIHDKLMEKLSTEEPKEDEIIEETEIEEITEDETAEIVEEEDQQETLETVEPEGEIELSDIAGYLGIDEDKLDVNEDGKLLFKTKIDGEEGTADLTQLIKERQLEGHLNKQNMEVTELKKQLNAQKEELQKQVSEKVQQSEDLLSIVYQELMKEYESVNWQELREDDPSEYSARQIDFNNRKDRVAQLYQQIQNQRQAASNQTNGQTLEEEKAKLVAAMGWKDTEQIKAGFSKISEYAINSGFSGQEFNSISDHKLIVALNKAMKYDELQKLDPKVKNKIRKAPKLAKPGQVRTKKAETDEVFKLRKRIKQTNGNADSVAAYLLKTGKV